MGEVARSADEGRDAQAARCVSPATPSSEKIKGPECVETPACFASRPSSGATRHLPPRSVRGKQGGTLPLRPLLVLRLWYLFGWSTGRRRRRPTGLRRCG